MYGLDSIRRFQEGGVTDALVRQYLDSRPGISESQIAQVMRETGVSPEQVARVTGADPGYVSQRYNQYLDLVDKSTVRPFSGPPSPAVSPAVSNSISLTPAGIAALAPSANVSSPANVFSPADYGPPSPIFDPAPTPAAVDPVAQKYVNDFNALINQGNYDGAARVVKEAELAGYGDEAYRAAAVALEANASLPPEIDFISPQGIQSIRDYVNTATAPPPAPVDPNVEKFNSLIREGKFGEAGVLVTEAGFTPEQVLPYLNDPNIFPEFGGNVTLETVQSFVPQTQAPPPAAPLSFTDQLNALFQTNLGRLPTEREAEIYAKDFGGTFSPELEAAFLSRSTEEMGNRQKGIDAANAIQTKETDTAAANAEGRPGPGQILGIPSLARQTQSNVPFAPLRRGLAQLRPAMYMPGLTSGQAPLGGSGFTPEALRTANQGLSPADRAYLMDVGGVSPAEASAAIGTPVGQLQAEYNQLRPGGLFSTGAPAPRGLPEDFALQTGAYGAPTPTFFTPAPAKTTSPSESSSANANQPGSISGDGSGDSAGPDPGGFDAGTDSPASVSTRAGGIIRMAEGGGPPKMAELSAKEAGSTFDISKYIDDEGRLVGGYSKPIYDENRVITGYDYRPYERDVVFGKELRDKEAAMQLTDAEREQMMIEMAMRQGRTGIDPRVGGLAGIEIGDPMMRRRPQYYSTVEQFRPRYAEGGNVSSTAQDLASRGRGGDTMLVHMAPHEVAGLNEIARMQGTELTINPETGMPEALKLGKLFKTLAPFIPFIPGVGQFLAPAFGALGMGGFSPLLQKAITSGVIGGFTGPKGGFDLQRGLMQGITAYGLGSLQQNLGGPSTPGGPPASTGTAVSPEFGAVDSVGVDSANPSGIDLAGATTPPDSVVRGTSSVGTDVFNPSGIDQAGASITETVNPNYGTYSDTAGGIQTQPRVSIAPETTALGGIGEPMKTSTALLTTGLGLSSTAESDKLTSAGIAVKREKEEEDELYRRLFERSLGAVPVRSGGLMKLAGGGMSYMEAGGTTGPTGAPREVVGNGDGMSDSVPADIEGVQEARLADGEFVIPADVVADIGNGSSDAGSKKLYDMMDRVRKARHGTTEQPPEIKAERLMPA
jgi:hypothetical protein